MIESLSFCHAVFLHLEKNGKFTSLSQRMSKALSIVRAGGDLNPSEPSL